MKTSEELQNEYCILNKERDIAKEQNNKLRVMALTTVITKVEKEIEEVKKRLEKNKDK